jgi:hypothetical protein
MPDVTDSAMPHRGQRFPSLVRHRLQFDGSGRHDGQQQSLLDVLTRVEPRPRQQLESQRAIDVDVEAGPNRLHLRRAQHRHGEPPKYGPIAALTPRRSQTLLASSRYTERRTGGHAHEASFQRAASNGSLTIRYEVLPQVGVRRSLGDKSGQAKKMRIAASRPQLQLRLAPDRRRAERCDWQRQSKGEANSVGRPSIREAVHLTQSTKPSLQIAFFQYPQVGKVAIMILVIEAIPNYELVGNLKRNEIRTKFNIVMTELMQQYCGSD